MDLSLQVVVSYSDIWDDEIPQIEETLSEIPSNISLQCISHFLGQLHSVNNKYEKQFEILDAWLSRQSETLRTKFGKFIATYVNERNKFNFINNYSSLYLTQQILLNFNDDEADNLSPEEELNLLKSYLIASREWVKKIDSLIEKQKAAKSEEDYVKAMISSQLPLFEIISFKNFAIQVFKSLYLFKFIETEEKYKGCLELFLETKELENWKLYLQEVLGIYISLMDTENPKTLLTVTDSQVEKFLSKFCLEVGNYTPQEDFINIREKPILYLKKNEYLFLNLDFLVDKIFKGVQFDLLESIKGVELDNGITFNHIGEFKSHLSDDFSEKYLFNKIVNLCFNSVDLVHIPESSIPKNINIKPDYYIRRRSKIFLFEFKDPLLPKEIKSSYDFKKIKAEIFKKIVEDDDGNAKGIQQLLINIEGIRNGDFEDLDETDFINAKYYPILVLTNYSFQLYGINYLIKKEFHRRMNQMDLDDKHLIKDPVIVDLDDLIKYQDLFKEKTLKINSIFDQFNNFVSTGSINRQITSFHEFMGHKTSDIQISPPQQIKDDLKILFE